MIALIQRVERAEVAVAGQHVAGIAQGLLAFVGVERDDTRAQATRMLERLLSYRVFSDDDGKMNLSVRDIDGGLLLVPQFTLAADTRKGTRPSFSAAAAPADGRRLFELLVALAHAAHTKVAQGQFGSDMKVSLVNDGPVTFWLQARPDAAQAPTEETS